MSHDSARTATAVAAKFNQNHFSRPAKKAQIRIFLKVWRMVQTEQIKREKILVYKKVHGFSLFRNFRSR